MAVTMRTTVSSRIPQIIAEAEAETQLATQRTASQIVAGCKARSRVDTGAMKAGWQSRRGIDAKTYEVFNTVYWTIFNEMGTVNMAAQPMLAPSVEEARQTFPEDIRHIWEQMSVGPGLAAPLGRFSRAAEARSPGSTFGG